MIYIDGKPLVTTMFGDGTSKITPPAMKEGSCKFTEVTYYFDTDTATEDILNLLVFLNWVNDYNVHRHHKAPWWDTHLVMPYVPYARLDKPSNPTEIATLKMLGQLLKGVSEIHILEPHDADRVSHFLSNGKHRKVELMEPSNARTIDEIIHHEIKEKIYFCFPDMGACHRYKQAYKDYGEFFSKAMIGDAVLYGNKHRDADGQVEDLKIYIDNDDDESVDDEFNAFIIDDICSYGNTFIQAAQELKKMGANNIYLFTTHMENAVLLGDVTTCGLFTKIFTTDTIFTKSHPLIKIVKEYRKYGKI